MVSLEVLVALGYECQMAENEGQTIHFKINIAFTVY